MTATIKKIKAGGVTFSLNKKGDEVKVLVGKEIRYIKYQDLWGVAFAMTEDDVLRDKIMPVRKTEMLRFKKVHQVQVKNDMKAGETLQFTSVIDVPTYVVEGMKDLVAREVPEAMPILDRMIKKPAFTSEEAHAITEVSGGTPTST